jgi:RNA polymerase sigma-70 factor (ECF subfamily)
VVVISTALPTVRLSNDDSSSLRSDAALLEAIAGGDRAAFRALYQRFQPRLHRLAYATLLDQEEAADVVQEVFVRLHAQAGSWRADTPLEPWLYRVTLNAALSWRRLRPHSHPRPPGCS